MYTICELERQQPDDPMFGTQEEAEIAAIQMSYNDGVVVVWDWRGDDSEIVALVYQQTVYSP